MTIATNYSVFQQHKWVAIYSACVAIQSLELAKRGEGISEKEMEGIKEDARFIADLECEGDAP